MSLPNVSSASLGIILKCLKTDPRHIDSLRKTCKLFNQQAVAMCLDKTNNVYLGLSIERIKKASGAHHGIRQYEKNVIEIRVVIKKKRLDMDPDCKICFKNNPKYSILPDGWSADSEALQGCDIYDPSFTHASDSENNQRKDDYPVGSGRKRKVLRRRRAEPIEDPNESDGSDYIEADYQLTKCSCKNWFYIAEATWRVGRMCEQNRFTETFLKAMKRVNSVQKLKIKCWRLADEAICFLAVQLQLRFLHKLVLLHCSLNVREDSFHRFIRSFPIKAAQINCKFRNYQLDNKALHNINNLTVKNVYGRSQFVYSGLTDKLLKYWAKKPTTYVLFDGFETKFTIGSVLHLIKVSMVKQFKYRYSLGIIRISLKELRVLLDFIQKKRCLHFRCINQITPYPRNQIVIFYKNPTLFMMNFQYKLVPE